MISTVKNSKAIPFFRESASCSKILNDKKYMISTVNSGHPLFFRASACKLLKTPECKKYIQYSEKFQGKLCFFRASASCSKIVNREKKFNTVYVHLGAIRAIWASVVCNLDQSHDCLHGLNLVGDTGTCPPTSLGGGI